MTASSNEYLLGSRMFADGSVRFRAVICNIAASDLTVSTYYHGIIGIRELKLDGRVVAPNIYTVEFQEDPKTAQAGHLMTLTHGQCTDFDVGTLDTINVVTSLYTSFSYDPRPGAYHLQFYYQYSGPDQGMTKAFRGIVTSNFVEFRVVQGH